MGLSTLASVAKLNSVNVYYCRNGKHLKILIRSNDLSNFTPVSCLKDSTKQIMCQLVQASRTQNKTNQNCSTSCSSSIKQEILLNINVKINMIVNNHKIEKRKHAFAAS